MRLNFFLPRSTEHRRFAGSLSMLGPSWRSSPVRRVSQAVFLVGFVVLLLWVCWPYGSSEYGESFAGKEIVEAEFFLAIDPLVSISAAIAARMWVWSLGFGGAMLAVCVVVPRAFCGYVCPLGTLLDVFDWLVGRRVAKDRSAVGSWWGYVRYFVLAAVLAGAVFGVMLAGFVSAVAVLTRAMVFIAGMLQMGVVKGWYLVPPMGVGHWFSIGMFVCLVLLGMVERRFWCKYLCPTGAMFSLGSVLRLNERKVHSRCVECGECEKMCSFGAIRGDYTTRQMNCTFCQSCAGVCPAGAIEFAGRWGGDSSRAGGESSGVLSRRRVVAGIACGAVAGVAAVAFCRGGGGGDAVVRPPGSLPEEQFLQLCVRCGQCMKVCPNNVLQPGGFENGFDSLWTPKVVADWSGCEPACNNCGQVCPTGAIRALDLAEKRAARMGLAVVDKSTCLPYAGSEACQLCADECRAAGYDAIEFIRVGGEVTDSGEPVEGSGLLAPVVLGDKCVGCGLCQMRCRAINVKDKHLLAESAIRVMGGEGNEDRIAAGSYIELQKQRRESAGQGRQDSGSDYLPDFLQ